MKPLKPRDKVTQRMTRAGLTLDNQTTGESMNISSREAEPEYTAKPGGTSEKALERAVEIRDRHKAKQAARHGERMAKEASGPASRLQFTAEERASPELAPYIKQAEKRADRLDAAKSALPKKRVIAKATVYDEAKGKARSKLHFEKVEKHPPKLKPNPASRPVREAGLYLHGKIHEVEQENVGVESGHKAEELAERQAGKALRNARRRHKLKPYRAAAKAERKSMAANAEFVYQKSLRDNPELAQAVSNPISRLWQKQHIKREYAKAARAAGRGAAGSAKTTASAARKAAEKGKQAASLVARHWKGALLIGGVGLLLMLIMGGLQSCTAMFGSAGTGLAATSYLSEDSDMLGAEAAYAGMEADLQYELDHYETLHPGHDEYRFELDEIGHDPYVLTSILSALHNGVFTLEEVQGDLAMLFEQQYTLTERVEVEIRYRTVTHTDSDGNEYEEEVPYRYSICYVTLKNADLSHLPIYILTEEQMGFYAAYMQTLGNRPDLFPNGSYPHASTPKEPTYYEIPPEALKDETFAAMIAEAEKYVGYPYVWGGSSPSTSFDCSGFISWVINHSGWNVGRQTAQGLYNICTPVSPEQAKPGDLVFFVGTYDTAGMSHVGLYVGNSVMLHCGDPISYTNLNSSYWQQHFYCYGRLP
ncbi:C40 family peptidase [Eisenbergiella tayi]|uniref:C40 family peptidase n=1 Tax=Eisenbergiella tayi TaxID=1432052 RepID=UPI0028A35256|nr:NlpC/P60 family protein [Eisenbergiella tayi]MDT4535809.1 NlpC/P60 family protein [Eisenbergiella tayi]